jgi:hypothetical protein
VVLTRNPQRSEMVNQNRCCAGVRKAQFVADPAPPTVLEAREAARRRGLRSSLLVLGKAPNAAVGEAIDGVVVDELVSFKNANTSPAIPYP